MRVFSSIVEPFVLSMFHTRQDFAFRRTIALQFIGNDDARDVLQLLEQPTEKSLGSLFVPSTLHEDIEHISVLIHRPPEVMSLTTNGEENLIQMPFVTATR